ncbi:MAG: glycosyltransferase [Vicinamibacterales bacterium]
MARVAVVSSHPPFTEGGHLGIARSLVQALHASGHEAELVLTPQNRFGRQAAAYLANWLTDVGESNGQRIDQVISLRFPAYAVRHPRHVCWLSHTMREYYDLWPDFRNRRSSLNRVKEGMRRQMIHAADRHFLGPRHLTRLFVLSRAVQDRLRQHIGVQSEPLYPPPPPRAYRCERFDDYVFAVSRLTPLKRFDLLLHALAEPDARSVRAKIAGEGEDRDRLVALARELGVDARVSFVGRLDDASLLEHYARCRAVCFTPRQEDYGFVTVEAFASGKPVITCTDSGGPAELVEDGHTGLVCAPTPTALAAALERLMSDPHAAERFGSRAGEVAASLTWPATVARLVVV